MSLNRKSNKQIHYFELTSSEIIKKAQMALEVLNQQQIYGNVYKKPNLYNPTNLLFSKLEEDFNKYSSITQIKTKEHTNIRLLPYDMMENIFPLTIQIQDLKNEVVIHIAYDKKFPNQNYQKHSINKKVKTEGNQKQHYIQQTNRLQNCAHKKINVCQPFKFTLENLTGKYVSKVYITFQAKSKYSVLNIYAEGNQYSYSKSPKKKKLVYQNRRIATQGSADKIIPIQKIQYGLSSRAIIEKAYIEQQTKGINKRVQSQYIESLQKRQSNTISPQKNIFPFKQQIKSQKVKAISQIVKTDNPFLSHYSMKFHSPNSDKKQITEQSQGPKTEQAENKNKSNLFNNKIGNLPEFDSQKKQEKWTPVKKWKEQSGEQSKSNQKGNYRYKRLEERGLQRSEYKQISKSQIVRLKREKQQVLKQKERQYRQLTLSIKSKIGAIQREQKEKQSKLKKINIVVAPIVYFLKFLQNTTRIYEKKQHDIIRNWRVGYLTTKFCRKIRRRYHATSNMIIWSRKRSLMSVFDMTKFNAKIMYQHSMHKATKVVFDIFRTLSGAITMNHAFLASNQYLEKIKKIQIFWKQKYNARMKILKAGAQRHIKQMMLKYPHFSGSLYKFKEQDICHIMVYQYMIDQSLKFKQIYEGYLQAQEERQQLIDMNYSIIELNKKNNSQVSKKKKPNAQLFNIPDKMRRPSHRFFTNFDILKSMLRGWFQTQSKKQAKSRGKSLKKHIK